METKMTNEIVKPVVINEVEFYISSDGTQSGVSQSGLARLCGVDEKTIRKIVNSVRTKTPSKALESFVGDVFHFGLIADKNARILTTQAATEIIFYYAFESRVANDTAKYSAREFAKQGMHNWIKEVTGFAVENNTPALNATLDQLFATVNLLTQEMKEWRTVRRVADANMEGVNILFEEINKNEEEKPQEIDPRTYTLMEWLEIEKGVQLSHGQSSKLGRAIAESYKSLKQQPPTKVRRAYKSPRGILGSHYATTYTYEDFPILETAYSNFVGV